MLIKNKRAISPVIATILLIALVVVSVAAVWVILEQNSGVDGELILESTTYSDINENFMVDKLEFEIRNIGAETETITSVTITSSNIQYPNWVILSAPEIAAGASVFVVVQTLYPGEELTSTYENVVTITTQNSVILKETLDLPTKYSLNQIGEAGSVLVDDNPLEITFQGTYSDPVVLVTPVALSNSVERSGTNAAQMAIVTDVSTTSFTIRQSGSQGDSNGTSITPVNYLVMETGIHHIKNIKIEVIKITASGSFTNFSFVEGFSAKPSVISSTQTNNNDGFPHTRINYIDEDLVRLKIENGEQDVNSAYQETVGIIAIEQGDDVETGLQAYNSGDVHRSSWRAIAYNIGYFEAPVVLAQITSHDGGHNAYACVTGISLSNFYVGIEEGAGLDGSHTTETMSWLALPEGILLGSSVTS